MPVSLNLWSKLFQSYYSSWYLLPSGPDEGVNLRLPFSYYDREGCSIRVGPTSLRSRILTIG